MTQTKTKTKTCASCISFIFYREDQHGVLYYQCNLANRPAGLSTFACSLWQARR